MKSLPPAAWGDVATKQDLEVLAAKHRGDLHEQTTKLMLAFIAVTVAALIGQTVLPHWFPPPAPAPAAPTVQMPSP